MVKSSWIIWNDEILLRITIEKVQNRRGNISGSLLERPQSIGKIGIPIIDYDHPTGP
jgi:hypothetical protein